MTIFTNLLSQESFLLKLQPVFLNGPNNYLSVDMFLT